MKIDFESIIRNQLTVWIRPMLILTLFESQLSTKAKQHHSQFRPCSDRLLALFNFSFLYIYRLRKRLMNELCEDEMNAQFIFL